MDLLNENISHDDLKKHIKELYNYASKELNIDVPPRVFLRRDKANAEDILGKTGGYDPDNQEIHLYITDRHPKDVLRSFAHELVHHAQKLDGFDDDLNIDLIYQDPAYAQHDEGLREMERDAFERGNMIFRAWTDGKKTERNTIMNEAKFKDKVKAIMKTGKSKESAKKIAGAMVRDEKNESKEKDDTPFEGGEEKETPSGKHKAKKLAKKGLETIKNKEKADLDNDGKLSRYEKKRGSAIEKSMKAQAQAEAKAHMDARHGKDLKEMPAEAQENLEENKEAEQIHPYPQLFEEKPRLMQDAFNKKEDLVYQELVRRFIKK